MASAPTIEPSPAPTEPGVPHVLGFVALLAVLNLWLNHHFGWGIRNPAALGTILTAIAGAISLAGKLIGKDEIQEAQTRTRRWTRELLRTPILSTLYVFVALAMLTISSVTVLPDTSAVRTDLTLAPLDDPEGVTEKSLESRDALVRFAVTTLPFGRLFQLEATGYVGAAIDVFPFRSRRVRLGSDLEPSPSLLVRPPIALLGVLSDGGSLEIYRVIDGEEQELLTVDEMPAGAVMIGRPVPIPEERVGAWTLQIQAELPEGSDRSQAQALVQQAWQNPTRIPGNTALTPGAHVRAKLLSKTGKLIGMAEVILGTQRLVDVLLVKVETP